MFFIRVLAIAAIALPAHAHAYAQMQAGASVDPNPNYAALRYRSIGPYRGGRVTAVAGTAAQPATFYMGATGGGVWKTTDYGQSWQPIADGQMATGSIGAIDVADSDPNVVYVGTGSAAIRSNVIIGKGMYKSTDAGRSWRQIGLVDAGQIGSVNVHPSNPDIVWVAALGNPFGKSTARGVYRTKDGGATWQRVLFLSDSVGAIDIAVNPSNPNELYAGMWRGERKPWTIISGAMQGGIYKSTDGGDSWNKLTNGLPKGLTGKNSISISRSNPSRVYVLIEAVGNENGVYRSDDGGETWQHLSNQAGLTNRQFYYTYIDADPKNPDKVWINNESFYLSTDGGKTWARRSTPHGDNHGMWINPDDPDLFIQSNDGGANVTRDGGRTWSTQSNQPTAEIYQVAVDNRWPYHVYGAQQDNSTVIQPSIGGAFRADGPGCETGPIAPHPLHPDTVYGACKGHFSRMNMKTGQEKDYPVAAMNIYGHNPKDLPYRFQRVAPMHISPNDPRVIYFGSQFVHRSRDEGATWEKISPDLTANEAHGHVPSGSPITRDITGEEYYPVLYAIAESKKEPGLIWAGANDGPIHVSRDNGRSWKNVTPAALPRGGRVQTIEPSQHTPGKAYVAVLLYLLNDWRPHLYKTTDYGATWTRIANGIPNDHPVHVIREDPVKPGLLFAGTEFGMFVSHDDGANWQSFQQNLPVTPITDMLIKDDDLVLSTMGRGFWIVDDITPLRNWRVPTAVTLFAPSQAYRVRGSLGNAPRGAAINYYLPSIPQSDVVIEIVDASGRTVRRFSSANAVAAQQQQQRAEDPDQEMRGPRGPAAPPARVTRNVGLNRFYWDLSTERNNRPAPMALPGNYTIKLTVDGATQQQPLTLLIDPRVAADGVTTADLTEQYEFQLKVTDLQAQARELAREVRAARDRWRDVARTDAAAAERVKKLDELDARLNDTQGIRYPQPMLIGQIGSLNGFIGGADQKISRSALARYDELAGQLTAIRNQLNQLQERD